jgi:hypothetical protein
MSFHKSAMVLPLMLAVSLVGSSPAASSSDAAGISKSDGRGAEGAEKPKRKRQFSSTENGAATGSTINGDSGAALPPSKNGAVENGKTRKHDGGYYDSLKGAPGTGQQPAASGYYSTVGSGSGGSQPPANETAVQGKGTSKQEGGYYNSLNSTPGAGQTPRADGYYSTVTGGAAGNHGSPSDGAATSGYYGTVNGAPGTIQPPATQPQTQNVDTTQKQSPAAGTVGDTTQQPAANTASPIARSTPAPVVSKPTMATAQAAFNACRYGEALRQFQILDRTGFCCDKVHYYIARCYQQLSQVVPALEHYAWVTEKSKNPTLRNYAYVASAQLSRYQLHRTYAGNGNYFQRASYG